MTSSFLIRCLLAVPALLAAAGCHPRDGHSAVRTRELARTDFEHFEGWTPALMPQLATAKAHSGKYSISVVGAHPYSPTFRARLGQLVSHRPRRLTLGAWVWVPDFLHEAVFVVVITNPGDPDHPVFRKEVFLNDSGPFQEWKWASRDLDIPMTLFYSSDSELVIYLLAKDCATPVYADDLRLTELW